MRWQIKPSFTSRGFSDAGCIQTHLWGMQQGSHFKLVNQPPTVGAAVLSHCVRSARSSTQRSQFIIKRIPCIRFTGFIELNSIIHVDLGEAHNKENGNSINNVVIKYWDDGFLSFTLSSHSSGKVISPQGREGTARPLHERINNWTIVWEQTARTGVRVTTCVFSVRTAVHRLWVMWKGKLKDTEGKSGQNRVNYAVC